MSDSSPQGDPATYRKIRQKSPVAIYRSGIRRRVPAGEPSGRELVVAHLAKRLSKKLSDAALAVMDEGGLIQMSRTLLSDEYLPISREEVPQEEITSSRAKEIADRVLSATEENTLHEIAEEILTPDADRIFDEERTLGDYLEGDAFLESS